MGPLSPTEECLIRCYRKVYSFVEVSWFWIWTNTLIYTNQVREMLIPDTAPLVQMRPSSEPVCLFGETARDNVVAATILHPDGTEEDFDEEILVQYQPSQSHTTVRDIMKDTKYAEMDTIRLSIILSDGSINIFSWDDPLEYETN